MDLKNEGKGKRRSKRQILNLLREFDNSQGITAKDFCKQHQISEGTFYSARKRNNSPSQQPTGFIALPVAGSKENPAILFAEVGKIRLYQQVPADYLKALAR